MALELQSVCVCDSSGTTRNGRLIMLWAGGGGRVGQASLWHSYVIQYNTFILLYSTSNDSRFTYFNRRRLSSMRHFFWKTLAFVPEDFSVLQVPETTSKRTSSSASSMLRRTLWKSLWFGAAATSLCLTQILLLEMSWCWQLATKLLQVCDTAYAIRVTAGL